MTKAEIKAQPIRVREQAKGRAMIYLFTLKGIKDTKRVRISFFSLCHSGHHSTLTLTSDGGVKQHRLTAFASLVKRTALIGLHTWSFLRPTSPQQTVRTAMERLQGKYKLFERFPIPILGQNLPYGESQIWEKDGGPANSILWVNNSYHNRKANQR